MTIVRLAKADVDGDIINYSGIKLATIDANWVAADITDFNEAMMDFLGGTTIAGKGLVAGTNVTLTYDDTNDKITIASTGGGSGLDSEAVLDFLSGTTTPGTGLGAGTNVSLSYNDAGNLLTINASMDTEAILDFLAGVTVAGQGLIAGSSYITLTYNDAGNVLSIGTNSTLDSALSARPTINDTTPSGTTVYSSNKIESRQIVFTNALPGSLFYVYSDDSSTTWKYNGATITTRPTSRADLIMIARTAGVTGPTFAIAGWDLLERAGS